MNNNLEHIGDEVLVKYLVGEATPAERQAVELWIAADEANKKHYDHLRIILEERGRMAKPNPINTDEAWQRFVQRTREDAQATQQATAPPATVSRSIPLYRTGWARSAALIVMLGCGWLVYRMAGGGDELISSGNSVVVQTLPDGSTVTLNRNSTLAYSRSFNGEKRSVKLRGEGFFNITPNKQKPFIIDAENASVTVVGTSFNVKSTNEETEVIVETGIVQVAKQDNTIRVLPNQKATVSKKGNGPVLAQNTDELYNYYRTKKFVCHGTPLWRLVNVLNEAFDANIKIANSSIRNMQLETTFHDEELKDILQVIATTFNITVEHRGNEILLK